MLPSFLSTASPLTVPSFLREVFLTSSPQLFLSTASFTSCPQRRHKRLPDFCARHRRELRAASPRTLHGFLPTAASQLLLRFLSTASPQAVPDFLFTSSPQTLPDFLSTAFRPQRTSCPQHRRKAAFLLDRIFAANCRRLISCPQHRRKVCPLHRQKLRLICRQHRR